MVDSIGAVGIDVVADSTGLNQEVQAAAARASRAAEIKVKADVDTTSIRKAISDIDKEATSGRNKFALTFKEYRGVILALIPSILGLNPLIGGLAAGLVAVTGYALQASASLVPLAGFSDVMKAQDTAFQEFITKGEISAETAEKLAEAMKNLSPEAREVAKAVMDLREPFHEMRLAVQDELLEGIGPAIKEVANTFLPILNDRLVETAGVMNEATKSFADFITEAENAQQVDRIMGGLTPILEDLLGTLQPLTDAFLNIFEASLPSAERISGALADMAEKFADFIDKANESGALTEFFDTAVTLGGLFMDILGNLGDALISVFQAGAEEGGTILDFLSEATQELADFLNTAEGQDALQGFFDLISEIGPIIEAMGDVLGPVAEGLGVFFDAMSGPIENLRDTLLPILVQFGEVLGAALQMLAPIMADLVVALTPLIGSLLTSFVDLLAGLIPIIEPLLPVFVEFVAALAEGLAPILPQLVEPLLQIAQAFADMLPSLIPLIPGLVEITVSIVELLPEILLLVGAILEWLTNNEDLIGTLEKVIKFCIVTQETINFVIDAVKSIIKWLRNWKEEAEDLKDKVGQAFEDLKAKIEEKISAIKQKVQDKWDEIVQSIKDAWRDAVDDAKDFGDDIIDAITGLPDKIVSAAKGGFKGAGETLINAFVEGMKSAGGIVQGIAGNVMDAIRGTLNSAIARLNAALSFTISIPGPDIHFSANIPYLAQGTSFFPGGMAMVGEMGPELVRMPQGSSVVPANQTGAALAQSNADLAQAIAAAIGPRTGPTINVNLPTGDPHAAALAVMDRLAATGSW